MKKSSKKLITAAALTLTAATIFTGVGIATASSADAAVTNKWTCAGGKWNFYKNGKKVTGWKYLTKADGEKTPHWSYFGKDGVLRTGWKYLTKADGEKTPHWSYFGPNGWLRTGWQVMSTKTNPDGKQPVHMSYFGSNGWLRTGWVKFGKGTAEPDGNSAVHWSYFGNNGWLRTGWQSMGKGTNNPDGNTARHTSFFGANGWLRTGLITFKKGTYNSDGNAPVHKSYFGSNGWLRTNQSFNLGNIGYTADSRGWLKQFAVYAKSIKLNKTSATIGVGKTVKLTGTISPSNVSPGYRDVMYASNNTSIATVAQNGTVTGKKAGTAVITAKTSNGKTATCKVTVKAASSGGNSYGGSSSGSTTVNATGISVKTSDGKTSYNFDYKNEKVRSKTIQLVANVTPSNATNKKVMWSSDDTKGATVDSNGKVTIKWDYVPRTIKITAKTHNGKTATFTIKTDDSIVPR